MARTPVDTAAGLTAADVVHERFSALPASATVAEVRGWFAASAHRRVAFLAEHGRYAGSLVATSGQRVPVVDGGGTLIGVVAVTDDLAAFCGATRSRGSVGP